MNIVILASTEGGVISRLVDIDYFKEKVIEVISDRECGAIEVAKKANIKTKIFVSKNGSEFSDKILEYLDINSVDLIISFYTKLLNKKLIDLAKGKIINLHPSILPACPGMDGFGDTVKSGSKFIGTTIHFIDNGIDTGASIIQSAVPFNDNLSLEEMRHLVFVDQCRSLLQVIKWFEEKRIYYSDGRTKIDQAEYVSGIYSPKLDFKDAVNFNVPFSDKSRKTINIKNEHDI